MATLLSLLSLSLLDEKLDDFSEMARIVMPMLSLYFGFLPSTTSWEWIARRGSLPRAAAFTTSWERMAFRVSYPRVAVSDPTLSFVWGENCSGLGFTGFYAAFAIFFSCFSIRLWRLFLTSTPRMLLSVTKLSTRLTFCWLRAWYNCSVRSALVILRFWSTLLVSYPMCFCFLLGLSFFCWSRLDWVSLLNIVLAM